MTHWLYLYKVAWMRHTRKHRQRHPRRLSHRYWLMSRSALRFSTARSSQFCSEFSTVYWSWICVFAALHNFIHVWTIFEWLFMVCRFSSNAYIDESLCRSKVCKKTNTVQKSSKLSAPNNNSLTNIVSLWSEKVTLYSERLKMRTFL